MYNINQKSRTQLLLITWTKIKLSLFKYVFSLRSDCSLSDVATIILTMKLRIPIKYTERLVTNYCVHKQ